MAKAKVPEVKLTKRSTIRSYELGSQSALFLYVFLIVTCNFQIPSSSSKSREENSSPIPPFYSEKSRVFKLINLTSSVSKISKVFRANEG